MTMTAMESQFPDDPWDDLYIYLHEWLVFYGKCR